MKTLGQKLKELRNSIDLSQETLAEQLGISIKSIQRYESNKFQPDTYTLVKFATYFDISVDYLLGLLPYDSESKKEIDKVFQKGKYNARHNILFQESARELEEALRKAEVFVETQIYRDALKRLVGGKVLVISGEPGMGKTSIAYQLGRYFVQEKGYENFFWVRSVDEIYVAQQIVEKKVIIFDDFWGSIFQESSFAGKDEQRLSKIIKRIKDDNSCILIMTTREYILKQGLEKHADLKEVIEKYRLECRLDEYSDIEKVKIFFGHLKQSKLNWLQTEKLFNEHNEIVKHANYNPRVIEMFLQNVGIEDDSQNCVELFWNYLECPENFWHAIFNNLSTEARLLSIILLISPIPSNCDYIRKTYYKCLNQMERITDKENFEKCLGELEKTVIKSLALDDSNTIIIKFQNPSVQDYLFSYLHKHINQYFEILLQGSCYYDQLIYTLTHYSHELSDKKYRALMQKCIDNFEIMPKITESFIKYLDNNEFEYFENHLQKNTTLSLFYKLICCYEKSKLPEYQFFFESFIKNFNGQMKNARIEIEEFNFEITYIHVIKECLRIGLVFNSSDIIATYFERMCFENRNLHIDEFKDIFPEEYLKFLNDYRVSIQNYLEDYYISELYYYVEINDIVGCKCLYTKMQEQWCEYGLHYTVEFKTIVEECLSTLDEVAVEKSEEHQEDNQDKELELAYNEIVTIFEKDILGEKSYLGGDELRYFIRNSVLSELLKNELMKLNENDEYWYIRKFLEDEDSFLFLERNLLEVGILFKNVMLFISQLIIGISSNSDIPQKQLIGFLANICSDIMYRTNARLTKEEIMSTKAYKSYFENEEWYFEQLVKSGFFIKKGRWYELVNILLVMIPYAWVISNMEIQEKIDYFDSYNMEDECPTKLRIRERKGYKLEVNTYLADIGQYYFENCEWENIFFKMFFELDPGGYLKHYVIPMIQKYFLSIKKETILETVSVILSDLNFTVDISVRGENVGGMVYILPVWRLIESLNMANIYELVPMKFTDERMKYVADKFELIKKEKEEVYRISFAKVENVETILKLGVDKSVVEVYERIKEAINTLAKEYAPELMIPIFD
jgi:Uncharacterized protein conserved in bacteria